MKKNAPLWSLSIITTPEADDAVGELLTRLTGESPVITHDLQKRRSTVAVFLPRASTWNATLRAALKAGLQHIASFGLDITPARIAWRQVPPADWRESWKRHFPAQLIGRHLLVRPSWSRRRPRPGQVEIVLDPGLSFGTGQHPTTAFCLAEVVRLRPRPRTGPRSLLDVGTGSGILAIAAQKLGYAPVVAFDFDPDAVTIAKENAAANNATTNLRLSRGDVSRLPVRPRKRFEVVCANLTADLLEKHASRLLAHVNPGGHVVLAGILDEQFKPLRACFERLGATLARTVARNEWRSASFRV